MGGKCSGKKQSPHFLWTLFFSSSGKKQSPWKVRTLFFFRAFSPHVWDSVFFRAESFGHLSPSLPLICWSQSFGYGFLASYGIIIFTRPNFLKTLLRKRAIYCALCCAGTLDAVMSILASLLICMSVMVFWWSELIFSFLPVLTSHCTRSPLSWPVSRRSSRLLHTMEVTWGMRALDLGSRVRTLWVREFAIRPRSLVVSRMSPFKLGQTD